MLKGTCRVKMIDSWCVGMCVEGTSAATRHSFLSQGTVPLRPLGVTSPHASHPHSVVSTQSLLVLKPPTGLLKGTERLSNSAYVFLLFCLKLPQIIQGPTYGLGTCVKGGMRGEK